MTRYQPQEKTTQVNKQHAAKKAPRTAGQTSIIKQYSMNQSVCTMNFFGAGSMKNDW